MKHSHDYRKDILREISLVDSLSELINNNKIDTIVLKQLFPIIRNKIKKIVNLSIRIEGETGSLDYALFPNKKIKPFDSKRTTTSFQDNQQYWKVYYAEGETSFLNYNNGNQIVYRRQFVKFTNNIFFLIEFWADNNKYKKN